MIVFKKSLATLGTVLLLLQGLPGLFSNEAKAATWKPAVSEVMSRQYPIVMGNQYSSGNIDATKLQWCAKNLDILVINKSGDLFADNGANSALANQIHAINPNVKVLQYVNIMDVWQSQPTYTWMKNNNAFLYDDAGSVVHPYQSSYGIYRWAGDPLKTIWQDYYAQHCKDMITQGMDGIFSDNWFRSNSQGWNINSTRFAQLQQGWETMGQKTKAAIGTNSILIGNSPAWSIYQSRDMTMIESRNAPNSSAFNQFLKDSDTAAGWGQATLDTIYWLWDGSAGYLSTYASILDFSLPACLLTDDIFGIPNNTTIMGIMDKVGKVGYPKGARYRASGILQRDFTAGKVLFNDTSASVTVSLPQGIYKNVDGVAVNTVTLGSYRGIVLKGSSTPVVTIPTAPTELAVAGTSKNASTGNTIVNLTWKDNATNETGFAVQLSTDNNNFTTVQTTSANTNSLNLDIGKTFATYYMKVSAVNSAGSSASSNTVNVKLSQTIPAAPTNLTAAVNKSTVGNYIVNLNWTDNSDNENNFEVYLSGNSTALTSTNPNVTAVNLDLGTSPAAGTYGYYVLASNEAGKSQPSNTGSIKIESVPTAPTSLALTSVTKGTTSGNYYVNLTWKDNATNETGYQILQASSVNGPFTVIKTPAVNAAGYSVNIGPNTGTFYYQVKAVNAVGTSAPSNTLEVKVGTSTTPTTPPVTVPAAPSNLTLKSVTRGVTSGSYYINLTWKDNSSDETGFQILESINSTSKYTVIKTPVANSGSYSVNIGSSPTKGTHYYQIVAVGKNGNSLPSNTVSTVIK